MTANVTVSHVAQDCLSLQSETLEDPLSQQTFSWSFRNFPVFPTLLF